jgi:hypothetical protein
VRWADAGCLLAGPAGGGDLAAGDAGIEDITQNCWAPMAITSSSLSPVSAIAVART